MTEPTLLRRCDQCAWVDLVPSVHPMRCRHRSMHGNSLAVGVMRASGGSCGPDAVFWTSRESADAADTVHEA